MYWKPYSFSHYLQFVIIGEDKDGRALYLQTDLRLTTIYLLIGNASYW